MDRNISELITDLRLRSQRGHVSTLSVGEAKLVSDALTGFRQVTKHWDEFGPEHGFGETMDQWRVE
jgi:hypothetical protein